MSSPKNQNEEVEDAGMREHGHVALSCVPLDALLGGGIERGVVTEVVGGPGSGKTTLGIMLAASSVLEDGVGVAAFIDTEGGLSVERTAQILKSRGIQDESRVPSFLKRILVRRTHDFAEQGDVIMKLARGSGSWGSSVSAIIVDSITSNYRVERTSDNTQTFNRELASQLRLLATAASRLDIPVLVTNQEYTDFKTQTPRNVAGDVLRYIPKTIMRLSRPSGIFLPRRGLRLARIMKHRFLPEGRSAKIVLSDSGFS